jgi:hypothetical protein
MPPLEVRHQHAPGVAENTKCDALIVGGGIAERLTESPMRERLCCVLRPDDRPRVHFAGLCCWSSGITDWLLSGMVSRPWSPLASRPPDVEVPLPLRFGAIPVVSCFLLAEVDAGRGVPGPPGSL